MEFEKMSFEEADRRYAELRRQRHVGEITDEEFAARRKELMVQDEQERWWAKGSDGEWYYRSGENWVKGTPPVYGPAGGGRASEGRGGVADNPPERRRRIGLWIGVAAVCLVLLVLVIGAAVVTRNGYQYVAETDDTEALSMEVPSEWDHVRRSSGEVSGISVPALSAGPTSDWSQGWEEPGVYFAASRALAQQYTVTELLDSYSVPEECEYDGRYDYEDPAYVGMYDRHVNCGESNATWDLLVAAPRSGSYMVQVEVTMISGADSEARETIMDSFLVDEELLP